MPHQTFDLQRRAWILASLAAIPSLALAQTMDFMGQGQAGESTQTPSYEPYRPVQVEHRYFNRVVELLEFNCPFCRNINAGAQAWGRSLPKPFVFEQMPLVYDKTTALAAAMYYVAITAAPALRDGIVASIFHAVQDLNEPPGDPGTYGRAAARAGVQQAAFEKAMQNTADIQSYVQRVATFCRAVDPRVTPTFVVRDKAVDVTNANGDYQKMFQLLNGFVSQGLKNNG